MPSIQPEDRRSTKVFGYLGVPEEEWEIGPVRPRPAAVIGGEDLPLVGPAEITMR